MKNILALNDDCLLRIYCELGDEWDMLNFMRTCSKLQNLVVNYNLIKPITTFTLNRRIFIANNIHQLRAFMEVYGPSLEMLTVHRYLLPRYCQKKVISLISKYCANLETLYLQDIIFEDSLVGEKLDFLRLNNCLISTKCKSIDKFFASCTSLKWLYLIHYAPSWAPFIKKTNYYTFINHPNIMKSCSTLTQIDIVAGTIGIDVVNILQVLNIRNKIKRVGLDSSNIKKKIIFNTFLKMQYLETVNINGPWVLSQQKIKQLRELPNFKTFFTANKHYAIR